MSGRMFGEVTDVLSSETETTVRVRFGSGELPNVGQTVQVLSGFLAARGCLATDEHNALVDARECVCAAIRAQVLRPDSYQRQQRMIAVLRDIDALFERPAVASCGREEGEER